MKRKLLSMILVLAMLTTLAPVSVFAEGEPAAVTEEADVQAAPVPEPTAEPTPEPTQAPTPEPTKAPTPEPTAVPTEEPEQAPVAEPEKEAPAEPAEAPAPESAEAPAPVPEKKGEPENTASEPEPVRVEFRPVPDGAKLTVFKKDEKGDKEEIKPEKDGSFLLLPGRYFYTLEAEGFEAIEEKELEVKASAKPVEIVPELAPIAEPAAEDEAVPAAEAGEEDAEPATEEAAEPAEEPAEEPAPVEPVEEEAEKPAEEEPGEAEEPEAAEEPETAEATEQADPEQAEETEEGEAAEEVEDGEETSNAKAAEGESVLTEGVTLDVEVDGTVVYLSFTPAASGLYAFTSSAEGDTYGTLYDSNMRKLEENDDDGYNSNFLIRHELTGSTTYYLGVRWYNQSSSGIIPVLVVPAFIAYAGDTDSTEAYYSTAADSPLTLNVSVTAGSALDIGYKWYKDWQYLEDEDASSLAITVTESATYECVVSDQYGDTQSIYFYVSVDNGFDAYIDEPGTTEKIVTVKANTTLTLETVVTGRDLSDLSVHWQAYLYETGSWVDLEDEHGTTLEVGTVTQMSTYYCYISDRFGNSRDLTFYVRVDNGFDVYIGEHGTSETTITVEPDDPATLNVTVKVEDDTDLEIWWQVYRNGSWEELEDDHGTTLTIDSVTETATYECYVCDRYGNNDYVRFHVFVNNGFAAYAHDTNQRSVNISVDPDQEYILRVDVRAKDPSGITYEWYRNGDELECEGDSLTDGPLTGYSANYTCYVRDRYGNSEYIQFYVYIGNGFVVDNDYETDVPVPYGDSATLTVSASANSPLTYTWTRYTWVSDGWDREELISGPASTYTTGPVTEASRYACEVTDGYGNGDTVYFDVMVENGLSVEIVNQRDRYGNVAVPYNQTIELRARATANNGDVTYSWHCYYYDEDGEWQYYEFDTNSDTITTLPVTGQVEYNCVVTDMYGGTDSDWVYLVVDNKLTATVSCDAEKDNDYENGYLVPYGDSVTITVNASAQEGDLEYSWNLQRRNEFGDWQYIGSLEVHDSVLETAPITESVMYQCVVSDKFDGRIALNIYFSVDNGFTASRGNPTDNDGQIPVGKGKTVKLWVNASARTGDLIYRWYKNTEYDWVLFEDATGSEFTTPAMNESTEFICEVTDIFGTTKTVWFDVIVDNSLTAYVKGTTQNWTDRYIGLGLTNKMEVTASAASGTLNYQWYIIRDPNGSWDWEEIPGSKDKTSWTSEPVERYTVYVCEVTDIYGSTANVWFNLYVDAPADFDVRPVGDTYRTVNAGDNVTLAVEVTGSGEFTYQWREIRGIMESGWDVGSSTDTLALPNIRKSGEYMCFVYDQYGNEKSVRFQVVVDNSFHVLAPVQAWPWDRVETDAAPGNNVPLTVYAMADSGDITYTWYRFDKRNWEYVEVQSGKENEYIVPSAGSESYYCRATDMYGTVITVIFNFFVDNQLTAYVEGTTSSYKEITVSAGKTAPLSVTAKAATGKLTYRWFMQTYDSSGNSVEYKQVDGAYGSKITTAKINMYTEYWCEVTDIYGNTVSVWFDIRVDNKLTAYAAGTKNTWVQLYVAEGGTAKLGVDASAASGSLHYQWYKEYYNEDYGYWDSDLISGETGKTFTTPPLSGYRGEDAVYFCRVSDKYGNPVWVYFYIQNADIVIYAGNDVLSESMSVIAGKYSRTLTVKTVDGAPISSSDLTWEISDIWSAGKEPAISVDSKNVLKADYVGEAELTARYGEFSQSVYVSARFSDVTRYNDYFYEPVYWAAANGVTTGTSPSTFDPGKSCTRGQIVTFLWRAYGSPEPSATTCPFTDVDPSAYYYKAVLWAVENDITTGTSPTTFAPNNACTRGHIVTFLWRAAGKPAPTSSSNPFKDVAAGKFYYDAVLWAVGNGITTGTSATTFDPGKSCTRGQCVTFLMRAVVGTGA